MNRKLREELDLKDELDKKRDEQIEEVKESLKILSKEVHDEIKELRTEVSENRKERREDIGKLGKKIDNGFKTAKKERGEENKEIKNDAYNIQYLNYNYSMQNLHGCILLLLLLLLPQNLYCTLHLLIQI
jgi:phenylalanyl-tRNA synthetase alpha subunit